jgi:hypothetical protein
VSTLPFTLEVARQVVVETLVAPEDLHVHAGPNESRW